MAIQKNFTSSIACPPGSSWFGLTSLLHRSLHLLGFRERLIEHLGQHYP
jgi:hypothetical protein